VRRAALAIGIVVLLLGTCVAYQRYQWDQRMRGSSLPPAEMFSALIRNPVPKAVSELQAAATTWQGYSAYLRFRAPSLDAAGISSPPYESVDCNEIADRFAFPTHMDAPFSPPWSPPTSRDRICVQQHELSNEWTGSASHFVVWADGWIHFSGSGS
jgi:hypothetical protein